jgi:hypothetical protein
VGLRRASPNRPELERITTVRRAAGDTHNAALRNLANKLLAKLWHCLQTGTLYNEATAWPASPTPKQAAA